MEVLQVPEQRDLLCIRSVKTPLKWKSLNLNCERFHDHLWTGSPVSGQSVSQQERLSQHPCPLETRHPRVGWGCLGHEAVWGCLQRIPLCLLGWLGSWHVSQEQGHRQWQSCQCCGRLWSVSTQQVSHHTSGGWFDLKRTGPPWIPLRHTAHCSRKVTSWLWWL